MPRSGNFWATSRKRRIATKSSPSKSTPNKPPPARWHTRRRTRGGLFVLRFVQPGLAGLMDGSVSTLAPLFAAAFATGNTQATFKVGLAASVGAGISMGFAEALSDDGKLSGRGAPLLRGVICGVMTMLGGLGHTLPYLISNFHLATSIAIGVVVFRLHAGIQRSGNVIPPGCWGADYFAGPQ